MKRVHQHVADIALINPVIAPRIAAGFSEVSAAALSRFSKWLNSGRISAVIFGYGHRAADGKLRTKPASATALISQDENAALRARCLPLEKTNPLLRPAKENKDVASR